MKKMDELKEMVEAEGTEWMKKVIQCAGWCVERMDKLFFKK